MKKTYMIPELVTIEIKTIGMLAQSLPGSNEYPTQYGAPSMDWDDDYDEE